MAKEVRGEGSGKPHESSGRENRLFTEAPFLSFETRSAARIRAVEVENGRLKKEITELRGELARIREAMEPVRESFNEHSESAGEFRKEQVSEAKEDYEQVIRRELNELEGNISQLSDEATKKACVKQIARIKHGIEGAIRSGTAAGRDADTQGYTLYIVNNYLLLTSTALSARVQDEAEKGFVDQIGDTLKGKLATEIWAVLSKLGRVQQWTVNGDVTISLFGLAKGNTGLSMTFTR